MHGDHLGSASLATNASGGVHSQARYKPFGETRWEWPAANTLPTDLQFTGQRKEAGIGLYDYGARFYDPLIGRFVSADTIVPGAGNPQSLNRYAYNFSNPLKYVDPSGHRPEEPEVVEASRPDDFDRCRDITCWLWTEGLWPTGGPGIGFGPTPVTSSSGRPMTSIRSDVSAHAHSSNTTTSNKGTTVFESTTGSYAHLEDPESVEAGKPPTPAQRKKIYEENRKRNNGQLKSDDSTDQYSDLVPSAKSQKGITPPANEAQIDHIIPASKGGTNSYSNLRVISRFLNRLLWDKDK